MIASSPPDRPLGVQQCRGTSLVALLVHCAIIVSIAPRMHAQPFVREVAQLQDPSFAEWIVPPEEPHGSSVQLFRRSLQLASVPETFVVHVSGDAMYRLYVNGREVVWGPAAGDLYRWNYETIDLARWLRAGENVLAAQVWREEGEGVLPARQGSARLAFIRQGGSAGGQVGNTTYSWRVA